MYKIILDMNCFLILLSIGCSTFNSNLAANRNLVESTKKNDIAGVKHALNNGAEIDVKNPLGVSALFIASAKNYINLVEFLIKKGAGVNNKYFEGTTPLIIAAHEGNFQVVSILLKNGANALVRSTVGASAIDYALFSNKINQTKKNKIVNLFLNNGVSPNSCNAEGQTLLMDSSIKGYKGNVEYLLSKGADVKLRTNDGYTALILASAAGKDEIVKILLSHGADVNAKANVGMTSLWIAKEKGYRKIVKMLKKAGAK